MDDDRDKFIYFLRRQVTEGGISVNVVFFCFLKFIIIKFKKNDPNDCRLQPQQLF